jgi:cation transport regulator ChaB
MAEGEIMKRTFTAGVIFAALAFTAAGQDWYHDREERFRGEGWRPRTDLEHVWSAVRASDKERTRLEKTEGELTKMQGDLDQGRWNNGILNDVIDSIRKSSNDDRLAQRDRAVLADDLARLKEFQDQHNHRP